MKLTTVENEICQIECYEWEKMMKRERKWEGMNQCKHHHVHLRKEAWERILEGGSVSYMTLSM